jgi:acetolactate synthase small subunit
MKELNKVNEIIKKINELKDILDSMGRATVETTVGLIDIHSAATHQVQKCEMSALFRNRNPEIERELKTRAIALINEKISKLCAELSEYVES